MVVASKWLALAERVRKPESDQDEHELPEADVELAERCDYAMRYYERSRVRSPTEEALTKVRIRIDAKAKELAGRYPPQEGEQELPP